MVSSHGTEQFQTDPTREETAWNQGRREREGERERGRERERERQMVFQEDRLISPGFSVAEGGTWKNSVAACLQTGFRKTY